MAINYGYFRHRFDAHSNNKLNKFIDEIGLIGYAYYFTLLELYGAVIAKKEDKSCAEIHIRVIANTWRKRVDSCRKVLTKLQLSDLLVVTFNNSTCVLAIPNYLKYYGSYKKTEPSIAPNKIKENKIKIKKRKTKAKSVCDHFDFESVYADYPRKEGKQLGLKKCTAQIKTIEDYDNWKIAIANYLKHVQTSNIESRYILKFSNFMESWRDYIHIEPPEDPDARLIRLYEEKYGIK